MQSMQKTGKPGDVSVLARSSLDSKELMAAFEAERARSFGSQANSSPDEEQHLRAESISPQIVEAEERRQNKGNSGKHVKKEQVQRKQKSADPTPQQQNINNNTNNLASIFPNQLEQSQPHCPADFLLSKLGIKMEMESEIPNREVENKALLTSQQQQQLMTSSTLLQQQQPPTPLQQQWFAQLLANNPYFCPSMDSKGQVATSQQNIASSINTKLLQTVYAAVATAAANNRALANVSQQQQPKIAQQQPQMPPQKKPRKSERAKTNDTLTHSTQTATNMDLSLQIPHSQNSINVSESIPGISPAMSDGSSGKLNSLISNLLSIRCVGSRGSPSDENDYENGKGLDGSESMAERKNKRKLRTPTRAEMAEIIYDDEQEYEIVELSQCYTENLAPNIRRLMEKQPNVIDSGNQNDNQGSIQQPSPAVSDSQTSGSSGIHLDVELGSPKKICSSCQELKAKLFDCNERLKGVTASEKFSHQNMSQIRLLSDRVASLAESLEQEVDAKAELLRCSKMMVKLCEQ